jgi:hypothetical protein
MPVLPVEALRVYGCDDSPSILPAHLAKTLPSLFQWLNPYAAENHGNRQSRPSNKSANSESDSTMTSGR